MTHTIQDLQGEEYEDVEADDPANGHGHANPDPSPQVTEAVLILDGNHEGVVRLAGGWLFPALCIISPIAHPSPSA